MSISNLVLSSRCRRQGGCAADGAPNDWRRALRLRSLSASINAQSNIIVKDVFKEMKSQTSTSFSFWFYPASAV